MRHWWTLLLMALLLSAGSVGADTSSPPVPPFAEPGPDAPQEFRWPLFRCPPGMRLSYDIVNFEETKVHDRVESKNSRQRLQISTLDRTGRGLLRVRFTLDNQDLLEIFLEETGAVADVAILHPELTKLGEPRLVTEMTKGLLRVFRNPLEQFGAATERLALRRPYSFYDVHADDGASQHVDWLRIQAAVEA